MADDPIDRSRLPIADPEFTGVANRTLEGSRPAWGLIGHVAPPEGAPNILLVLIDDAGFGRIHRLHHAGSASATTPPLRTPETEPRVAA